MADRVNRGSRNVDRHGVSSIHHLIVKALDQRVADFTDRHIHLFFVIFLSWRLHGVGQCAISNRFQQGAVGQVRSGVAHIFPGALHVVLQGSAHGVFQRDHRAFVPVNGFNRQFGGFLRLQPQRQLGDIVVNYTTEQGHINLGICLITGNAGIHAAFFLDLLRQYRFNIATPCL